ncbi:MAG: phytanoyl-CoA dioxygenase family protein [Phaeodactylibacter sp.]|nr:phytanoyl-CoA dioxygenase family protein [Phaeodactylibacter sp.]
MEHQIGPMAYIPNSGITEQQVNFYKEQGFLIGRGLLSPGEIATLRAEAVEIFKGNRGEVEGIVPPDAQADASQILSRYTAIHFPHKISPVIREALAHPAITGVLQATVSPNVKCMQSMLFVKAPGKPGQAWHQDEYYIPTRDRSLIGAWIAIDDADLENGCLWIIPGSHCEGYIRNRVPYDGNQYGDTDTCVLAPYSEADAVPVEVPSGSIVFFNGYLLHRSLANKSRDRFRMALVNHYMSAESMLPWDQDGSLEPREDMRDIIMVAGEDPYAYKGVEDLSKPFLRAEKVNFKTQGIN